MKYFFTILIIITSEISVFSHEIDYSKYYLINEDGIKIYLGMKIITIENLIGKPHAIEKIKRNDIYHNNDVVIWNYKGLKIVFDDFAELSIIQMLLVQTKESEFHIGNISNKRGKIDDVIIEYGQPHSIVIEGKAIFSDKYDFLYFVPGHPEHSKPNFIYYIYDIPKKDKWSPYGEVLQFWFDDSNTIEEVLLVQDNFY